ncbi:hypothetical protein LEP1GSC133_0814 [Leptospira borgpetersenii serovar Pomona str. 200901868]|uniref:Uncharacterized protein n=1 Tax=Leptospira borgpetersenii serovar Pomona str. 200901868 TaxID=1192866 RepID=M6WGC7_LEPBO|nr:hypothetical protein LEP1GSC133_0814 [Leptospira borgpetersenii serovar Pomona str. 200901868]
MIDFANDPLSFGDLVLDPSNDDLQIDSMSVRIVLSEVREMFEMTVADDLDYPEIYSRQRAAQNSNDSMAQAARIRDAERILNLHPMIDTNSIDVGLNSDNRLVVSFKLKSGEAVQSFVMR